MVLYFLQLAAAAACAISGALAAGQKNLDLIGVMVISMAAAMGGGTLRDLLLDRNPVFWLSDNTYPIVAITAGLITCVYTRYWAPPHRLILTVDAIGLALFTIIGIRISLQAEQSDLICLFMGVITGVAGGVVRDILCGEIPMTFRRSELYASASFLGGGLYLLLLYLPLQADACALISILVIFSLRVAALRWGWHLPTFRFKEDRSG